ncbi:MAG: hypothetical protein M3Y74_08285, partial [Chloroflexota bacterium]|nr:hypothetical protein [Chloroflexota bacterium]
GKENVHDPRHARCIPWADLCRRQSHHHCTQFWLRQCAPDRFLIALVVIAAEIVQGNAKHTREKLQRI